MVGAHTLASLFLEVLPYGSWMLVRGAISCNAFSSRQNIFITKRSKVTTIERGRKEEEGGA